MFPAVRLVTFKLGFNLTCTPAAVAAVVILLSPVTATVSPNFLIPVVPLSPLKVKPVVSTAVLAAAPLAMSVFVCAARSTA